MCVYIYICMQGTQLTCMFGVDFPVYGSNPPKNKGNLGPAIPTDVGYEPWGQRRNTSKRMSRLTSLGMPLASEGLQGSPTKNVAYFFCDHYF